MIEINKSKARALFNDGKTISIWPCKIKPYTPYTKYRDINKQDGDFDVLVNDFQQKCCKYKEGLYPAFYLVQQYHEKHEVNLIVKDCIQVK